MRKCTTTSQSPKTNAYDKVTQRVIDALEAGVAPWRQPWKRLAPVSIHGRKYRGMNAVLLSMLSPHESPVWLTFNQARERGGSVRKGEKGTPVLLWKPKAAKKGDDGATEERGGFFCTTYTVFNLDQCDGVEAPAKLGVPTVDPVEAAEALVAGYLAGGVTLEHHGDRAFYQPSTDRVVMPPRGAFDTVGHYYSTLFHELVHSTGHLDRLARDFQGMGTDAYSFEELVAELGAAMLMAEAGLEQPATLENSAAYVASWLGRLKGDRQLLVKAASAAQKAVDTILGANEAAQSEAA